MLQVPTDGPEFQHLDRYERQRLQELMVAIDKANNNNGKLEGDQGPELVALLKEYRDESGERVQFNPSNHLQKFSLDLANVKKTDTFGFYNLLDTLRRKLELTPLIFPHERESLLELYRAVDTDVVGDGLDAAELDKLSTGVIKIGEYLRAKMDGLDDNPNVSEEEWLEYFGRERGDPEWLQKINQFRAKVDLPPMEPTFTNCYVIIGDDVQPLQGAHSRQVGRVPDDSHELFVCFNHSFGKEPITDIVLMEGDPEEVPPPSGYKVVDGNLGTRTAQKYLCVKRGLPAINFAEVCYGDHPMDGYHTLRVDPHAIDGTVTLRWLRDGEEVPEVLSEFEIQQREIAHQLEQRQLVAAEREQDLQRVYAAIERVQELNCTLQMSISGFLQSPSPSVEAELDQSSDKTSSENERRFAKLVQQWCDAKVALERLKDDYNDSAMDLQNRLDTQETKANEIKESFEDFKMEITRAAENSRTGKKIPDKIIAQFDADFRRKDEEVERMRITDIKLRMQLRKLSKSLQQKEELQDGIHMVDFEQLKIENQTLNEKIEERNEELQKFRKKASKTVQTLTHIKEKLHFCSRSNESLQAQLDDLDAQMTRERATLTSAKAVSERAREEAETLKGQRGFVSNRLLVLDYETRKHEMDNLRDQVDRLKEKHRRLTLGLEGN